MTTDSDKIEVIKTRINVLKDQIRGCKLRISLLKGGDLPQALTSESEMLKRLVDELSIYQSGTEVD